MNYTESKKILAQAKEAKSILLNCHRGPDPDSIGSALAMLRVLKQMKKQVDIVCPSEILFDPLKYLADYKKIKGGVDFSNFDFSKYDLFITLDSSSWGMVTRNEKLPIPDIPINVIDHHKTNTRYGDINLVDRNTTSVGEMLFRVFKDWGVKLDKLTANYLLVAIIGDTGAFKHPGSTGRTFEVASELMAAGADKDEAIYNIYRSLPLDLIKFYGEVLTRIQIDKKGKFVWAAIPNTIYKKLNKPQSAKESAASLFTQVVDGTEFGFLAVELEKGKLSISFRSRTGFDTSNIAKHLGGGGHVYASGATITDLSFEKAVDKLLKVTRKYAKKGKR
jgi:phosphoesterase RecJ-like protein